MKSKTSNTLFISALVAGIAAASAVVAPAQAQTAEPVCVDDICYDVPATPAIAEPVDLDASTLDIQGAARPAFDTDPVDGGLSDPELFTVDDASYQSSVATVADGEIGGFDTVIGSVDRTAPPTLADGYLDENTLLPDNSELIPVENVTGVGLKSTF